MALALVTSLADAQAPQSAGERLADACASCHGVEGSSATAIPSLAGMDKDAFIAAMRDFRAGHREATIMNRIVRGYTDEDITALAAYYSTRTLQ